MAEKIYSSIYDKGVRPFACLDKRPEQKSTNPASHSPVKTVYIPPDAKVASDTRSFSLIAYAAAGALGLLRMFAGCGGVPELAIQPEPEIDAGTDAETVDVQTPPPACPSDIKLIGLREDSENIQYPFSIISNGDAIAITWNEINNDKTQPSFIAFFDKDKTDYPLYNIMADNRLYPITAMIGNELRILKSETDINGPGYGQLSANFPTTEAFHIARGTQIPLELNNKYSLMACSGGFSDGSCVVFYPSFDSPSNPSNSTVFIKKFNTDLSPAIGEPVQLTSNTDWSFPYRIIGTQDGFVGCWEVWTVVGWQGFWTERCQRITKDSELIANPLDINSKTWGIDIIEAPIEAPKTYFVVQAIWKEEENAMAQIYAAKIPTDTWEKGEEKAITDNDGDNAHPALTYSKERNEFALVYTKYTYSSTEPNDNGKIDMITKSSLYFLRLNMQGEPIGKPTVLKENNDYDRIAGRPVPSGNGWGVGIQQVNRDSDGTITKGKVSVAIIDCNDNPQEIEN